ncbi:MAG: hypothetical protein AB8B53_05955 [Flavobacteriales bacterium]
MIKVVWSLMFVLSLASCSLEPSKDALIGKWHVVDFSADMPKVALNVISHGKEIALSYTYTFLDSKEFILTSSLEDLEDERGSWSFNKETNELKIIHNGEYSGTESFTISSFSASKMIWIQELGNDMGSLQHVLEKE